MSNNLLPQTRDAVLEEIQKTNSFQEALEVCSRSAQEFEPLKHWASTFATLFPTETDLFSRIQPVLHVSDMKSKMARSFILTTQETTSFTIRASIPEAQQRFTPLPATDIPNATIAIKLNSVCIELKQTDKFKAKRVHEIEAQLISQKISFDILYDGVFFCNNVATCAIQLKDGILSFSPTMGNSNLTFSSEVPKLCFPISPTLLRERIIMDKAISNDAQFYLSHLFDSTYNKHHHTTIDVCCTILPLNFSEKLNSWTIFRPHLIFQNALERPVISVASHKFEVEQIEVESLAYKKQTHPVILAGRTVANAREKFTLTFSDSIYFTCNNLSEESIVAHMHSMLMDRFSEKCLSMQDFPPFLNQLRCAANQELTLQLVDANTLTLSSERNVKFDNISHPPYISGTISATLIPKDILLEIHLFINFKQPLYCLRGASRKLSQFERITTRNFKYTNPFPPTAWEMFQVDWLLPVGKPIDPELISLLSSHCILNTDVVTDTLKQTIHFKWHLARIEQQKISKDVAPIDCCVTMNLTLAQAMVIVKHGDTVEHKMCFKIQGNMLHDRLFALVTRRVLTNVVLCFQEL